MLRELRAELRNKLEGALNSIPSLLGGSSEGEKSKPDIVSRNKAVQAVLDFAEASQWFRSRAPRHKGSLTMETASGHDGLRRGSKFVSRSGSFYIYIMEGI